MLCLSQSTNRTCELHFATISVQLGLFARYKQAVLDVPEGPRMVYALAREKFREYILRQSDERPFAHP